MSVDIEVNLFRPRVNIEQVIPTQNPHNHALLLDIMVSDARAHPRREAAGVIVTDQRGRLKIVERYLGSSNMVYIEASFHNLITRYPDCDTLTTFHSHTKYGKAIFSSGDKEAFQFDYYNFWTSLTNHGNREQLRFPIYYYYDYVVTPGGQFDVQATAFGVRTI